MPLRKWIPNAISISRGLFLAPLVCYFAIVGSWKAAFTFLVLAIISDLLDGQMALWLDAKTYWGERYFDPVADFMMTISSAAGLLFSGVLPWWLFFSGFLYYSPLWTYRYKYGIGTRPWTIAKLISSFSYTAIIGCIALAYYQKAFGNLTPQIIGVFFLLAGLIIYWKWNRIKAWCWGRYSL